MKTICFISLAAYPLFNTSINSTFGGSEIQLYQLSNKLVQDLNYQVFFVVGDYHQPKVEIINGITILRAFRFTKIKLKYIFGFIFQFNYLLTLHHSKADIYIQRAAGIETGLTAMYCRLFRKKFVYMTASSIDTNGEYKKMYPLNGIFYEYGLRNASNIVCQNADQQVNIRNNYHLKSKIIKNSFEIPKEIPNDKGGILWVGSSQCLKQPQLFLDLAKSLPQYKFTIILPKNDINIWKLIRDNASQISNLNFIENVPFKRINNYFFKSKLFVNTSTYEGFPNTFVQAAMYRTPIISLNVNPDNFLDFFNCGICCRGNIEKLEQSVNKLMTDQKLWASMSKNSYKYAKDNHDINKNINEIKKLILLY